MLITRATHPTTLWPGVKAFFGLTYQKWEPLFSQIFDQQTSDKAYEIVSEATGFGLASRKSEGASIVYDTDGEGPQSRFTNVTYGLGYIVSREEIEDDQYTYVSQNRAKALSFSMQATKETVHANILNRAFDTNYVGGDGKPLIATDHPTRGGLQSNKVADADLSESSIEDAFKAMWSAKNARGLPIVLQAKKLVIHPSELFNATRSYTIIRATTGLTMQLWPVPAEAVTIAYRYARITNDVIEPSDPVDVPQMFQEAVWKALAVRIAPMFGQARADPQTVQMVAVQAAELERDMLDFDRPASYFLGADLAGYP